MLRLCRPLARVCESLASAISSHAYENCGFVRLALPRSECGLHRFSSSGEAIIGDGARLAGRDKIHLKGLQFYGFHGVLPEENRLGQPFEVDVTLVSNFEKAGKSDDLSHTVNYAEAYRLVKGVMEGPPLQLLECVADRICHSILTQHSTVVNAKVHVKKKCIPAVPAVVGSIGIEIERDRDDYGL